MKTVILYWFDRYLASKEAVVLLVLLLAGFTLVLGFGDILAPVFASIVLAYLLHSVVVLIEGHVGRTHATLMVFTGFMSLFLAAILLLIPILGQQLATLFEELPRMAIRIEEYIQLIPPEYQSYFSEDSIYDMTAGMMTDIRSLGKAAVTFSISSIPGFITILLYMVLIPLMVFFFLKDNVRIQQWFVSFLPDNNHQLSRVWVEVDRQIGNYVRGKCIEVLIVGVVTYIGFVVFNLKYAILLASLVGLSVLIPYVGAAIVTIPVMLVAMFQFGFSSDFFWTVTVYTIIQILDGNLLVPILFSEAVNLHPVAILIAILGFGGLWGLWGMFFAIPLAAMFKALLDYWPRTEAL